ncbi:DUF930 domain-containing protein [Ochrobactrum sp. Marseille-Q0166]|uniref:DUF930 domain-containing protein n=1 Tax=Ochrobactrum sp. Marseille-Q0166 TaxID=2761105 RepID=UPI001654CC60|nr:DUF930 domain-containing protein [Ochrobactrum sp. Marseille-Q0166]MBC8719536.1 DUF930 domain-containing protein [Ochrobactrum sp. Marseille-Q0166]
MGGFVSVCLHSAVLTLLLISFPVSNHSVAPEDVKVELVPPPSAPSPEPTENKPVEPSQSAQAPQAYETATNEEKENTKIEPTDPTAQEGDDTPQPVDGQSDQEKKQSSAGEQVLSAENSAISVASGEEQQTPMVKARRIYSKDALSNPRVKQALGKLSPTDRVIQICGIEALEQIRHHRPDIVPDMMARTGGALTASSLKMSDGAFRSRSNWYNLDFDCKINPEDMNVTSFQYAIGDVIPKKDWSRRELPAD